MVTPALSYQDFQNTGWRSRLIVLQNPIIGWLTTRSSHLSSHSRCSEPQRQVHLTTLCALCSWLCPIQIWATDTSLTDGATPVSKGNSVAAILLFSNNQRRKASGVVSLWVDRDVEDWGIRDWQLKLLLCPCGVLTLLMAWYWQLCCPFTPPDHPCLWCRDCGFQI